MRFSIKYTTLFLSKCLSYDRLRLGFLIVIFLPFMTLFQNCSSNYQTTFLGEQSSLAVLSIEESAAVKVLLQNCNSCHGVQGLGELSNITDLNHLIVDGYVVPGEPSQSKIYKAIVDKTMPPTYVLSVQDQTILNNWILSLGNKAAPVSVVPDDLSFSLSVSAQPHLYRHRLLKVYSLVGNNSTTYMANLLDNRYLLGDYDYSIGVTPKFSLETNDIYNWLTSVESVCRAPSLATKYIWPNGASSFMQTALARSLQSVDTGIINDIQATAATDIERMEILCMATLTSLEFLSK